MEFFIREVTAELARILQFWSTTAVDQTHGGFIGRIDGRNMPWPRADKGSVLHARILWSFSAAYVRTGKAEYLTMAHRTYEYLLEHFIDSQHGGLYWTVDYKGKAKDAHKQIYAQAFAVYGLSEYYRATAKSEALDVAEAIVDLIEKYGFDAERNGYKEAFEQDWSTRSDQRLSLKDINGTKTANTHLHLVEAYANLHDVSPSGRTKEKTKNLIELFLDRFIDPGSGHLNLFFDDNWQRLSSQISYGHDIETSWLLPDAAEKTGHLSLLETLRPVTLLMVNAALDGLASDGAIQNERLSPEDPIVTEKHWWVQAESMVGLYHAWRQSNCSYYRERFLACWDFTKRYILDHRHGDWIWGININQEPMEAEDKLGPWKCPYHNTRFCLEIIKRYQQPMG